MDTQSPLTAWQTFFFLVGSAGAGLTGLQFVVIALIAESSRRATTREIQAFGTPTILHFCAVLLVSAILNAPWQGLSRASFALGVCGVLGVVYGIVVIRRTWSQTTYKPVWEDWLWHTVLPLVAYTMLLVGSFTLTRYPRQTLFVIAGAALLLLFVGIHNAWDAVTYITIALPASDLSVPPAVTGGSLQPRIVADDVLSAPIQPQINTDDTDQNSTG